VLLSTHPRKPNGETICAASQLCAVLTPDADHDGSSSSPRASATKAATRLRPFPSDAPTQHCRRVRPPADYPSPTHVHASPVRCRWKQLPAVPSIRAAHKQQLLPAAEHVPRPRTTTVVPPRPASRRRPALRTEQSPAAAGSTCRSPNPAACACAARDAPRGSADNVDASAADDAGSDFRAGCNPAGLGVATGQSRGSLGWIELTFRDSSSLLRRRGMMLRSPVHSMGHVVVARVRVVGAMVPNCP